MVPTNHYVTHINLWEVSNNFLILSRMDGFVFTDLKINVYFVLVLETHSRWILCRFNDRNV